MFAAFDISTSALVAQRTRLNAISSNIANANTTRNEAGKSEAYRPRHVIFQTDTDLTSSGGGNGVRVSEVVIEDKKPITRKMPGHPDADENGNVAFPNINMIQEFTDALQATRAYEANLGVVEITKDLGRQTLRILA